MTNFALIGKLEEKLNEIQLIVNELRGSQKIITSPVFTTLEGQDLEAEYAEQVKQEVQHQTLKCSAARPPIEEVGEAFFEGANKVLNPKTANQLRAEVIEKAKGFVESVFKEHWNQSGDLVVSTGLILYTVEFVVNEEKRQVNALLRSYGKRGKGAVDHNGKAICNPSDVFNEHIGRAIALGRALGLDVSEFEQAVQPNEYVVGQEVTYTNDIAGKYKNAVHQITSLKDNVIWYENNNGYSLDGGKDFGIKIFNDTNAQYGDLA